MRFKRSIQRYGRTIEPDTPYSRAGSIWDSRLGSAHAQSRNWRIMAFGSLVLSMTLSGGLLWQASQSRVVPYVVTVDHLGEPRAVGPALDHYDPDEAQIAWFLGHYIRDLRSVSLDPIVLRANWLEAYRFSTDRAALFLNSQARLADPFASVGVRTVSADVTSVVRISDRSFQVKWIEQAFERGNRAETSHWTAILTIIVKPPTSVAVLRTNPLGLYVDALDWNRELGASPADALIQPRAAASPPAIPPVADPTRAIEGSAS
jgi:type IV secretory pathway TrbF-like protein